MACRQIMIMVTMIHDEVGDYYHHDNDDPDPDDKGDGLIVPSHRHLDLKGGEACCQRQVIIVGIRCLANTGIDKDTQTQKQTQTL